MLQLFVLQLQNDKWFLHIANDDNDNKNSMLFECQSMYEFVAMNPPMNVYETITIKDMHQVNNQVKTYMQYFGIENVRGGIYTDVILPEFLMQSLALEIQSSMEEYTKPFLIFESLRKKEDAILVDYEKKATSYTELLNMGYKKITMNFCKELEWLETKINYHDPATNQNNVTKLEESTRYKALVETLSILREKYYLLEEDKISVLPTVFIKYPTFVFDYFIYHQSDHYDWEKKKGDAIHILKQYEFMAYVLLNTLDCMEFSCFSTE